MHTEEKFNGMHNQIIFTSLATLFMVVGCGQNSGSSKDNSADQGREEYHKEEAGYPTESESDELYASADVSKSLSTEGGRKTDHVEVADRKLRKEGFKHVEIEVPPSNREDIVAYFGRITMEPEAKKNTIIDIPNIYFDYDKATIREESFPILENIVNYLNGNPEIRVELSAHTDARGSDWYNLRLSDRRAKSTLDYLVEKGIAPSRLISKGYGEKMLRNHCKNGVQCSDEEHEYNRRVEMKIL